MRMVSRHCQVLPSKHLCSYPQQFNCRLAMLPWTVADGLAPFHMLITSACLSDYMHDQLTSRSCMLLLQNPDFITKLPGC